MTGVTAPAPAGARAPRGRWAAGGWRRIVRDQPLIPLIILLAVLVLALQLAKPGIVNGNWLATTLRAARARSSRMSPRHRRWASPRSLTGSATSPSLATSRRT